MEWIILYIIISFITFLTICYVNFKILPEEERTETMWLLFYCNMFPIFNVVILLHSTYAIVSYHSADIKNFLSKV